MSAVNMVNMMKSNDSAYTRETYLEAYRELLETLEQMGIPAEVGSMIAKNLQAEKSLRRMTAYLKSAHPTSMEMIADEMVAIIENRNTWINKKKAEESNSRYNAWLNSDLREYEDE